MIGRTVSHYKILEKPRHKDGGQVGEGGMSPARTTAEHANFVRPGGENHPRAFFASGCDFQDLPSFLTANLYSGLEEAWCIFRERTQARSLR